MPDKAAPIVRKPPRPLVPEVGPVGRFFSGIAVRCLCALPSGALRRVASFVGGLAWVLRIRRKVTLDNLSHAFPELPEPERRRIAKGAYRNMALVALESVAAPGRIKKPLDPAVRFENREVLDRALAEGKGVLLVSAHLGNWERLGEELCRRGLPVSAVVRPLSGAINERIVRSRLDAGLKLIHPRGAMIGAFKALSRGEMVAMLVDQVISAEHGVFVPFFGRLASTNPAVSVVARRTGAPVLVVLSLRDQHGLRICVDGPFPVTKTEDAEADVRAHTALINSVLEGWIRRYPDQWLWLHRRWKVQPPPQA